MPCHFFSGGVVCSGRTRRKRCKTPGHRDRWAVADCDWKLHEIVDGQKRYTGKTCDAGLCDGCRKTVGRHETGPHAGEPKDLCPAHYAEAARRGYLNRQARDDSSTPAPAEPMAPIKWPHELWLEAKGDRDRYVELMRAHGHIVPDPAAVH
jgi:hypothetical protein